MDRKEYNRCVGETIKAKDLGDSPQTLKFCAAAKVCAGKAGSLGEAKQICSLPKEPKATAPRRSPRARVSEHGMRMVFLTSTGCAPCSEAKKQLQDKIDSGEIEVLNVQTSAEAADLAQKHNLYSVPKLLVLDRQGNVFSEIEAFDKAESIEI